MGKANWIRSLVKFGLTYDIAILEVIHSADDLPIAERWWIAYARACGWPLTNATDGGEGLLNPAASTRAKMSHNAKLAWQDPDYRTKAVASLQRVRSSPEARNNNRERQRKRLSTPEAKAANAARFNVKSPTVRAAIGAASKQRQNTPEGKARQAITKARFATEESRQRHGAVIASGMARPEVAAKLLRGEASPTKRPEVRAKMSESALRRRVRERAEFAALDADACSEILCRRERIRQTRQADVEARILAAADHADGSRTRGELVKAVNVGWLLGHAAITALLARGELVQVKQRRSPRVRTWLIWTPRRALDAKLDLVDAPCALLLASATVGAETL